MTGWLFGGGPWGSYQGQPGQAYMQGQQANSMAQGFPSNTAAPPPSNPFQNLTQTQAAAQAANNSLAAGGTGAIPGQTSGGQGNFIDNLSKMFGGGQGGAGGGFNWQQMLAQGAPHLANGQPLGQSTPPPMQMPQGQAPLTPGLLANVAASRQPLMNTNMPANTSNNFGGMGLQNYLMMMRGMLGQ